MGPKDVNRRPINKRDAKPGGVNSGSFAMSHFSASDPLISHAICPPNITMKNGQKLCISRCYLPGPPGAQRAVPMFFFQAQNDFNLAPSRVLC